MFKKTTIIISIIILSVGGFYLYSNTKKNPKIEQKIVDTVNKIEDIKETIAPKPTKILSSGYPDKHLIKTIFVPQAPEKNWDQPWQDACEEAALLTVHYYYQQG